MHIEPTNLKDRHQKTSEDISKRVCALGSVLKQKVNDKEDMDLCIKQSPTSEHSLLSKGFFCSVSFFFPCRVLKYLASARYNGMDRYLCAVKNLGHILKEPNTLPLKEPRSLKFHISDHSVDTISCI